MPTTTRNHWPAADSCPNGLLTVVRRLPGRCVAWRYAIGAPRWSRARFSPSTLSLRRKLPQLTDTLAAAAAQAEPSGEVSTLTFFNRPIVVLRARVLGRGPRERVTAAEGILGQLVEAGVTGPVAAQTVEGGALITVGVQAGVRADACRTSIRCRAKRWTRSPGRRSRGSSRRSTRPREARRPGCCSRPRRSRWRSPRSPSGCSRCGASRALPRRRPATRSAGRREDGREGGPGRAPRSLRASRLLDFERRLVNGVALLLDLR